LDHIKGSYNFFLRPGVADIVNIQERNSQAKGYRVREFLRNVERLTLRLEEDE
jgi:hypothetical protein